MNTVTHPDLERVALDSEAIARKRARIQELADLVADPLEFTDSEIKSLLTTMLNERSDMSWRVSNINTAYISLD